MEDLLSEFSARHLQGATILSSHGMMQELNEDDELRFVLSLRNVLNPAHKENRTIFMAATDDKVPSIIEAVNKVTGGLEHGDTGILFTLLALVIPRPFCRFLCPTGTLLRLELK